MSLFNQQWPATPMPPLSVETAQPPHSARVPVESLQSQNVTVRGEAPAGSARLSMCALAPWKKLSAPVPWPPRWSAVGTRHAESATAIWRLLTFATAALGDEDGVAETCWTPPATATGVDEQDWMSRLEQKRIAIILFIPIHR